MTFRLLMLAPIWAVGILTARQVDPPVRRLEDGSLFYVDQNGGRVPDFSYAGYRAGGVDLPHVPTVYVVEPREGDDGAWIQAALDALAQRAPDAQGHRGAVQLANGEYQVAGQLRIRASGIVLRGSGATTIVATGDDRRTLITAFGDDTLTTGPALAVTDETVAVGADRVTLSEAPGWQVGDRVRIDRPSTKEWIAAVEMAEAAARTPFQWRPGQWDMSWERTVVEVDGPYVQFDAPLTTALEQRFGGATARHVQPIGRLREVGIENLNLVSAYDAANPLDEEHAWMAVQLDHVEDAWVAGVTGTHFASSVVDLGPDAYRVTVQDCAAYAPVSEDAGYRRHSFHTSGQLTLFLRCTAEYGRHDFTTGYLTTGPNVFLHSRATLPSSWSGSLGSWSSGVLFDNVIIDGQELTLGNHENWNQGVGWSLANSMVWQCQSAVLTVRQPPTATNWSFASWGQFRGDGQWSMTSEFATGGAHPPSLYLAQLEERLGKKALQALAPVDVVAVPANAQSGPAPIVVEIKPVPGLRLENGWLQAGGELLIGREQDIQWWRGSLVPQRAAQISGPSLTRFVPGRTGLGFTDDLSEVAERMVEQGRVVLRQHYGLWYDRRRDDHERTRRISSDVWPPFYELPFARTGNGETWNRLSRYDLTRYNPWYFRRLREFAAEARTHEVVMVNEMYFQHNIIEAGAHWVDFPWRPANAVQNTGFTEPPPFDGDTVKMADEFYDLSREDRRAWHRAYIRQCLANLAEQPNVIHTTSAEYTGPLHFMQFWLDVVAEWEAETGHHPLIALSATKDVQDAILADPKRNRVVDVIDFTYWYVDAEGALFAPEGGQQLAPRQFMRLWKGKRPNGTSLANMAAEYRAKYPDKAVMTGWGEVEGWPWVAAGGSFAALPKGTDSALLASLATMRPVAAADGQWTLAQGQDAFFCYSDGRRRTSVDLTKASGRFTVRFVDLQTGHLLPQTEIATGGRVYQPQVTGRVALWLTR